MAAAALESVSHLRKVSKERVTMHSNALKLQSKLRNLGLPLLPTVSHITPVLVGDAVKCKQVSDTLLQEYDIYVQPINFPTVPRGTERLRITPLPVHTEEMMNKLLGALDEIWDRFSLPRREMTEAEVAKESAIKSNVTESDLAVGGSAVYSFYEDMHLAKNDAAAAA